MTLKILPYTGEDDGQPRLEAEQEEAIQRTIEEFEEGTGAALWGSDMDTGKTLQACEVIIRTGVGRVLIIGVKDTFGQWAERLAAQSDGEIQLRRIDATKGGKAAYADMLAGVGGIYFSGSQYLTAQDWTHDPLYWDVEKDKPTTKRTGRPLWKTDKKTGALVLKELDGIGPWAVPVRETERRHLKTFKKMAALDLLIFDEIHMVANRKAIGRYTLGTFPTHWKLGMSGTWMGNKFENAWSITRWAWGDLIDSAFTRWKPEWCEVATVRARGGREVENVTGEKNPGEFVRTLPCYIRLESPTGPVPAADVVYVDLSPKQREQYDDLERDLMTWIESRQARGLAPLVTELPITLRMRLRTCALGELSFDHDGEIAFAMNAESSKLSALRGVLDYFGSQPVAIYTHSKKFAKVAVARMQAAGYDAVEWSGDVTSKQRDEIKRRFLAGEVQYIVAVIAAFNAGLDGFQKVCNKVVWLSEEENNVLNNQAIKRYWRRNHGEGFQHVKIVAKDTHDLGIFNRKIQETLLMNEQLRKVAA